MPSSGIDEPLTLGELVRSRVLKLSKNKAKQSSSDVLLHYFKMGDTINKILSGEWLGLKIFMNILMK